MHYIVEDDSTQCLSCGELTSIKTCPLCREPVCEKCWEEHTGEHGLIREGAE